MYVHINTVTMVALHRYTYNWMTFWAAFDLVLSETAAFDWVVMSGTANFGSIGGLIGFFLMNLSTVKGLLLSLQNSLPTSILHKMHLGWSCVPAVQTIHIDSMKQI